MWQPISLRVVNLFSHIDTTFEFNKNEMILFIGRNGTGKSTVVEGVTLAITGDVYRGVSKDQYIRLNQNECKVVFVLDNPVLNINMTIERIIYNGEKSGVLRIFENDVELPFKRGTAKAELHIFNRLGISREDFLNYFVIGQGNDNSFFSSTDTVQKQVISRFSNYTSVDKVLEGIVDDLNLLNEKYANLNTLIQNNLSVIEVLQQQNRELSEDHTNEFNQLKKDLNDKLQQSKKQLVEYKDKLSALEARHQVAKNELNLVENRVKDKANSLSTLEKELKKINDLKEAGEETLNELRTVKRQLETHGGNIIVCPNCKVEFILDVDIEPVTVKQHLKFVQTTITEQEKSNKAHYEKVKAIKEQIRKADADLSSFSLLKCKVLTLEAQKENNVVLINDTEQAIKDVQDRIATTKLTSNKKLIDANKKQIAECNAVISKAEQTKLELDKEEQLLHMQEFHLGKNGFKTYLANKAIRLIQDITNYHLQKFETGLQVYISGYTILKSGDIREKIDISIIRDGIERGAFKRYSGGQKNRVDLCGIIAIHKLINNSSANGGLNLLMLDENVVGLDREGQLEIIQILEKASITSVLVMHHVRDINTRNKLYFKLNSEKVTEVSTEPFETEIKQLQL